MQYRSDKTEENNISKAAFVCGILSVVGIYTGLPGVLFGIAALVLAGKYKRTYGIRSTYAQVGFYCGLAALLLAALNTIRLFFVLLHFIRYSALALKYFPHIQDFINSLFR